MLYIWEWFLELHNGRQYGMEGGLALQFMEIKAWREEMNIQITPQEIRILKKLDLVAIKNRKKDKPKK